MPKSRQLLFKENKINLQPSNAAEFLSLLNDPKCTMAPFVTTLLLNFSRYLYNPASPSPIDELAQCLVDKCTGLTFLKFLGPGPPNLSLLTGLSSSITHLELLDNLPGWGREVSAEAGAILDVVGNFTVLEVLTMYYDTPGRGMGDDPISPIYNPHITKLPSSLPRLRRLELDVIWNAFLPWFLLSGVLNFPGLETMELNLACYPFPVALPLLQSFLNLYSSSVRNLILRLMWWTLPGEKRCLRI